MTRTRPVLALIVGAGSLGAGVAAASTLPPASTAPPTTAHEDQAAAEAALLTIDDFPEGWTEEPEEEMSALAVESRRRIAECAGGTGESLLDLGGALAETGTFTGPDDQSVEESVAIVDEPVAEDLMTRFVAPGVTECFADAMDQTLDEMVTSPSDPSESFPADTEFGNVTVEELELTPAGDDIAGYRITVPLTTQGLSLDLVVDAVAIRSGDSIAGLSFQTVLEPFTTEEIERYVDLAVERLPS